VPLAFHAGVVHRRLLEGKFGILGQPPGFLTAVVGGGAQLAFPDFAKQNNADIGAAEMFSSVCH
jgi:hypothetical protein